jgi:hypothetical protein
MSASVSSFVQCFENTVGTSCRAGHNRKWDILFVNTSVILRKLHFHKYCVRYDVWAVRLLFSENLFVLGYYSLKIYLLCVTQTVI